MLATKPQDTFRCSTCKVDLPLGMRIKNGTRNGVTRYRAACRDCETVRKATQRAKNADYFSLAGYAKRYAKPKGHAAKARIDFGGGSWVALSTEHLALLAMSSGVKSMTTLRLYLLVISRFGPNGSASFRPGELAGLLGVSAPALSKALADAKNLGLIHEDSVPQKVWVSPSQAQQRQGLEGTLEAWSPELGPNDIPRF